MFIFMKLCCLDLILSLLQDHIFPFVSSICLRRILHPGVHHSSALRSTLLDYNRHYTDSEFLSLTVDGLRNEIISIIEHKVLSGFLGSLFSIVFFHNGRLCI